MRVTLLYSGGLDSTVLLYKLLTEKHTVLTLLFHYGQTHFKELDRAKAICRELSVGWKQIDIACLFGKSQLVDGNGPVVVPNRNMVMLSMAGAYAAANDCSQVVIGCNADDYEVFPDCRMNFIWNLNAALELSLEGKVSISAPFIDMSKKEIVALGRKLNVPFEKTWSCYAGGAQPCGTCPACKLREESLCLK